MGKEYQFPDIPQCKGCGFELSGKRVELGAMRGSQPMGYCPKCGYPYQIVEIESEPEPEPEPEPQPEPEPEPDLNPSQIHHLRISLSP